MISPFEATLRSLTDASRQYDAELARFAANTQRAAKRDAAHIIHTAERLIRETHDQLHSASLAIRRRRRRARRRAVAVKQKRRSPLKPLSTNDVVAAREDGSRARNVKQLLQNDQLRRPVEPAVPLVAPLAASSSPLSPAPSPSSPAPEVHVPSPSRASSLRESPQPPVTPPAHARSKLDNESSHQCQLNAQAAREAATVADEPSAKRASPSVDDQAFNASPSVDHHPSLTSQHNASPEQSARLARDQSAVRDRRSSATVESYETANAELPAAHAARDIATATSCAIDTDASPARSVALRSRIPRVARSCSTDRQSNDQKPDHHEQSLLEKTDGDSPREERSSRNRQDVREQHDEQVNGPEQKQVKGETPQPASNEPIVRERLSESLHSECNQSSLRSSSHSASSFENEFPADVSCDKSGAQPPEHKISTAENGADDEHQSPHSDSRRKRQASFSQPQSDVQNVTPEAKNEDDQRGDMCRNAVERDEKSERSCDTERNSDDRLPESTQGAPEAPARTISLQIQQPATTPEAVQIDEVESPLPNRNGQNQVKHKSPPSQNNVIDESASRRSQQKEIRTVEKPSIESRGKASDAILAKETDSCNTEPVERKAIVHEAAHVSSEGSASSPAALSSRGNNSHPSNSMPAPPQLPVSRIPRKPSRFVVDNAGKIDHSSLNVLSRMISAKPADTAGGDAGITTSAPKLTTPRTTRLFKPNNNIYSLQQNGNASPVQHFSSSNRSSVLSHTPGAEAPFRRQSPGVSRKQRLESLNKQLESFQSSKGAGLQGPELQMAELRHGRIGAHVLGDLGNPNDSQMAKEGDKLFRSVRERTLKLAETHVKDTSKIDKRSLHAKGAMTTPARDKLRARERSKSKSAFRSQLQEIMTGKAYSANNDEQKENECDSIASRFLEISGNDDPTVKPKVAASSDGKLSRKRSIDGNNVSLVMESKNVVTSPEDAQLTVGLEIHDLRSEPNCARSEVDRPDKGNEFLSEHPSAPFSNIDKEEDNPDESDVSMRDIERAPATNAPLANLVTSIVSFLPGSSSLLGTRPTRDQSEETEAEAVAKRQKLDMERREAEVQARREAQRLLKQKETEEKQRRAEKRRLLLARADKEKEEEKRRKEARRMKKKLEEEEARKKKRQEDDKKKEERRRLVLEKRAQNEMKLKRKKKVEPVASRKVPKGISRKSWTPGHGASHTPDSDIPGNGKRKLSETPSTPVAKSTDTSHGPSNYDMTPAQETVFELSDEEEERRKHKRIPQWAQGPKLSTAARDQPDPDDVFVNVPTCDLREVFGNVRRFRARTSSANWTRDRVTAQEMMKFRKGQAAFNEPRQ